MRKTPTINPDGYEAPMGVTADPAIFTVLDGELAVLLSRRADAPAKGRWALPGGFVASSESSRDTAARKLTEKTGMPAVYVSQLGVYDRPGRDPRGWVLSVAYVALVAAGLLPEDAADHSSGWHAVSGLPQLPFDHDQIVADGVEYLRGQLWRSSLAAGLLPPEFTLREAAVVFSAVDGRDYRRLDNFSRDLLRAGLIEATGASAPVQGKGGPRPRLFRFTT